MTKLKEFFPLIQERDALQGRIQASPRLTIIFNSWTKERQTEFLDFCTGVRGIKILYDSFFKETMNPEYAPERLESFLSVVLKRKVRIVRILPNDSTRISDEASLLVTDIIVELEDGSLANVEIQKIGYMFSGERSACYSSDMLLRQYKRARSVMGDQFSYGDVKNVYLIVIYEKSPKEFHKHPGDYYHYGKQVFDTGLQLNMLQEFVMIPLDIFKENMHNKIIETPLEAWLTFLTDDNPERVVELITRFPEFKPMYETLYQMCLNVERMMNMFSEELRIMDRNTVKYMIEEQEQEIKAKEQQLEEAEQKLEATEQQLEVAEQQLEVAEQQLTTYKEAQRNAVENLLRENMEPEKIASILGCETSYVEEVKQTME